MALKHYIWMAIAVESDSNTKQILKEFDNGEIAQDTPDGLVITDEHGKILYEDLKSEDEGIQSIIPLPTKN